MINLKDYNIVNGVAYPKGDKKIETKKPEVKSKVISKDDLQGKEVENEKAR